MIRLRKNNGSWVVRWRRYIGDVRSSEWSGEYSLEAVQQIILEDISSIDNVICDALKVIDGTHKSLTFTDGELHNSSKWRGGCLTLHLRHLNNIENAIKEIQSGNWKIRQWITPAIFEGRLLFPFSSEPLKSRYLIATTIDESAIPSEVIV